MKWLELGKFAVIVLTFLVGTFIPWAVALKNAHKKRKNATTESERVQADAELQTLAKELIVRAEQEFKDYNNFLKARGQSAGSVKKESVLTNLKAYAIEKGYTFIDEDWDKKIDELVTFTRNVNAKS